MATSREICEICKVQFSKYKCPKCDINYCSLKCYQSQYHGECSELFYKNCVIEELSQQKGSLEDKKKMYEILKRIQQEEEREEEEREEKERSLEERMKGIDLDCSHEVWSHLTDSERKQFNEMYVNGTLAELVVTTPTWWESIPKIHDVHDVITTPTLPLKIPHLSSLIKMESVSQYIPYNILNVLYSYVFTVRHYNNNITDLPVHATKTLLDISSVLYNDVSFATVHDSLDHAVSSAIHCTNEGHSYTRSLINDVLLLIERQHEGKLLAVYALSDVFHIINMTRKSLKHDPTQSAYVRRLFVIRKKVEFFISWICVLSCQLRTLHNLVQFESQITLN